MKTCLLLSEEQKINAADQSSWFLLSEEFPCSHSQIHQLHDKAVTSKTSVSARTGMCVCLCSRTTIIAPKYSFD